MKKSFFSDLFEEKDKNPFHSSKKNSNGFFSGLFGEKDKDPFHSSKKNSNGFFSGLFGEGENQATSSLGTNNSSKSSFGTNNTSFPARALYTYKASSDSELSFKEGDMIEVTENAQFDWWKGKFNGKIGYFPSSYVQVSDVKEVQQVEKKKSLLFKVRALYDYDAPDSTLHSFKTKEVFFVFEESGGTGWLLASPSLNGELKYIPETYVEVIQVIFQTSPKVSTSNYSNASSSLPDPMGLAPPPPPILSNLSSPSSSKFADQFEGEWRVGENIAMNGKSIALVEPTQYPNVYDSVTKYLQNLPKYEPQSVEVVYSPGSTRLFHGCIEKIEKRENMAEFSPNLQIESNPQARQEVLKTVEDLAALTKHNRGVKIIKAWHGTSVQVARKIMEVGFANLAKLDSGWFGKGIYFSTFPEYALRYCKDDYCLIMCYLILANPFPMIIDDAPNKINLVHYGKANYKNYGSHYVPVIQYGSAQSVDFRPPPIGKPHQFDEVVVFQEEHILPKFIVHLTKKNSLVQPSPNPTNSISMWTVDDVVTWIKTLPLSQDYSPLIKSNHLTGLALETMKDKEDWKDLGVSVFGDIRALSAAVQKLVLK